MKKRGLVIILFVTTLKVIKINKYRDKKMKNRACATIQSIFKTSIETGCGVGWSARQKKHLRGRDWGGVGREKMSKTEKPSTHICPPKLDLAEI